MNQSLLLYAFEGRSFTGRFAALAAAALVWLSPPLQSAEPATPTRTIAVDAGAPARPLDTSFIECIGAGRANEGLRADWQEQLREAKRAGGFKYIRMHGLLSDDMGVYSEDEHGNAVYNWQYIDRLYDFLLSIDVRPFVELSFMPAKLASGTQTIFWWKGNITPPKSYEKWADLIRNLTRHFQERYGHDEVKTWYFEVWNEPDLRNLFFTGDKAEYFKLYDVTARAIKAVSADYRVGGPATATGSFDESFIAFCHDRQVPLDFISSHAYGVKSGFVDATGTAGTVLDADPSTVIGRMVRERQMIDRSPLPHLPLHFTEWSSSYTPTDYIHDTYQQAAYILSKVKGAHRSVDSMSYWVFTDIFEEDGPRSSAFHGGFGLINYQGLKKPAFYAFKFLHELGGAELPNLDPASWVCRGSDGSIQILFWNYTPVVPPAGMNDQQFYRREIPAAEVAPLNLNVANLRPGSYSLLIYRTGYRINDVFTRYIGMGSPPQLTPGQVEILRAQGEGRAESVETLQIASGQSFRRSFPLRQNDVYLVKLQPLAAPSER